MPSVTVSSTDEETGGGSIGQGLLNTVIRTPPGTRRARGAASSVSGMWSTGVLHILGRRAGYHRWGEGVVGRGEWVGRVWRGGGPSFFELFP